MSGETLPSFSQTRGISAVWNISSETANQWTHAAGLVAGILGAVVLLSRVWPSGDLASIVGCTVYAVSLVALYAASTLSHSFQIPHRREFFRMLDQVCIFLFIVSSFTPLVLVHMRNSLGWVLLSIMWALCLMGCYQRIRARHRTISPWFFVPLGWMPILTLGTIYAVGSWAGLAIVLAGGLSYSAGVWFLMNDHRHPYFHAVWHLSTMTGTCCHFLFTLWYIATPGLA